MRRSRHQENSPDTPVKCWELRGHKGSAVVPSSRWPPGVLRQVANHAKTVDAKWTQLLWFLWERKRVVFKPRWGQLPGTHNFTEGSTEGMLNAGSCMFSLHQESQIITTKDISENHRLYLMLSVRARLRASEVWDQNSGRFLLLSWVWHVSFRLFAHEAGVQCALGADRACALKFAEVIVTLVKAYLLWEPGSWAHKHQTLKAYFMRSKSRGALLGQSSKGNWVLIT